MALISGLATAIGGGFSGGSGDLANSPDVLQTGDTDISFDFTGVGTNPNTGFLGDGVSAGTPAVFVIGGVVLAGLALAYFAKKR